MVCCGSTCRAAAPGAVKGAGRVNSLETMRAEEIALRLDKVRGSAAQPVAVEIGERRGECRRRQAGFGSAAPRCA